MYYSENYYCNVSVLQGMILNAVTENDDEIIFRSSCGRTFKMFHSQNCCESVSIEDIDGDLQDLVGVPIVLAEEFDGEIPADHDNSDYESYTYTFYRFRTIKGSVTIRWFGTSNGYYSESVDFMEIK